MAIKRVDSVSESSLRNDYDDVRDREQGRQEPRLPVMKKSEIDAYCRESGMFREEFEAQTERSKKMGFATLLGRALKKHK